MATGHCHHPWLCLDDVVRCQLIHVHAGLGVSRAQGPPRQYENLVLRISYDVSQRDFREPGLRSTGECSESDLLLEVVLTSVLTLSETRPAIGKREVGEFDMLKMLNSVEGF